MSFAEKLEMLRQEAADAQRLVNGAPSRRAKGYDRDLAEALNLINRVRKGDSFAQHILREVMTTSDFTYLTGDIMNRTLLAQYATWQPIWNQVATQRTVPDFRNVTSVSTGQLGGSLSVVPELAPYPARVMTDSGVSWAVVKHGERVPFSWEAMINDDLDALSRIPNDMANLARQSEDRFVTGLFAGTSGPLNTVYTSGNRNIINTTNGGLLTNPALSIAGLEAGFAVLGNQYTTDSDGNKIPIMIPAAVLMVPPALEGVARNIMNATEIIVGADSGTQRILTNNWMRNKLTLVVNPWLPIISTTNGNTSWYLFAAPGTSRPAMEFGLLRGHEAPEIFMKSPNAIRIGGGALDPFAGDFDTDAIEYKIRHIYGGSIVDAKMTVASNGTGS